MTDLPEIISKVKELQERLTDLPKHGRGFSWEAEARDYRGERFIRADSDNAALLKFIIGNNEQLASGITALLTRIEELEAEAETARGFEMTWKNHRDELLEKNAAAEAKLAEAVKVKPLEWLSDREPFFATTPFCRYRISPVHDDTGLHWQTTVTYQGSSYHRSETEVEAKAAAQADYESRIRSALSGGAATVERACEDRGIT